MRMTADHAGVAAGALYLHFESKDHMIREAYKELEGRFLTAMMQGYPSHESIRRRFSHLADGLMRHCVSFPAEFLFMDQFLSSPYAQCSPQGDQHAKGGSRIVQLFREGREKRLFEEIPPAMLLVLASGPVIQVLRGYMAGIFPLSDELINRTVRASWQAVSQEKPVSAPKGYPSSKPGFPRHASVEIAAHELERF